ncbi:MAG: xylulokinase, partial [Halarsenatibacteraceae bacterium]
MQYLLGLDIGTSGVKGILINLNGEIILKKLENYELLTPEIGWTEQNPDDWWEATKKVIQNIVKDANVDSSSIKGIGISGQMHSSVFLDKNNSVIRPAILWSDTRTTSQCELITEKVGGLENLINYVSNSALEGFTAPKVLWLKENEPENYKKVNQVLMPKDYIRYKLTGEIFTDISDAAGTLMFDVQNKVWSKGLLSDIGINPDILPPVLESTDVAGKVTKKISAETGLSEGTPVVAGGADQSCGAVGSGIVKSGRVMVSLGSSGVVLAQTDNPVADEKGRVHLFNYSKPD